MTAYRYMVGCVMFNNGGKRRYRTTVNNLRKYCKPSTKVARRSIVNQIKNFPIGPNLSYFRDNIYLESRLTLDSNVSCALFTMQAFSNVLGLTDHAPTAMSSKTS